MDTVHRPVLLKEIISGLDLKPGDTVLDGTLGGGGHSLAICQEIGESGNIVALDADKDAIEKSQRKFIDNKCQIKFFQTNFRNLDNALEVLGIKNLDKALFDLGLSSDQLETSGRGFSFLRDEPLLMTFKKENEESSLTAREIVNSWSEESLADIIYGYGGEKYARRIARAIAQNRNVKPVETTNQLVGIIESAVPFLYKRRKIHFATKTFQALRITVNDEIGALREGLEKAWHVLRVGGRIAVISFHELEDRAVKKFFKNKSIEHECLILTKKPITASDAELKDNTRSRSAKLRIAQKLK